MSTVSARFDTPNAGKYLQQLCKHFAHKVPAEWTPEAGHVAFPFGACRLTATNGILEMTCEAETEEALPRLVKVLAVHLERFAFREPPELIWLRDGKPDAALMTALAAMPDPHKAAEAAPRS